MKRKKITHSVNTKRQHSAAVMEKHTDKRRLKKKKIKVYEALLYFSGLKSTFPN